MSARNTVHLTTRSIEEPLASMTERIRSSVARVSGPMPPSTSPLLSGFMPTMPETNRNGGALTASENGAGLPPIGSAATNSGASVSACAKAAPSNAHNSHADALRIFMLIPPVRIQRESARGSDLSAPRELRDVMPGAERQRHDGHGR